jgi:Tetratricopeptide repeat
VKPDFELTPENADAVERITAMLGGLPLAIELAAARIRLLSPESLVERLDRPLPVLVGGRRDAPARQQTVRNTIEWSTHLLTEDERTMLWQLGVFAGRFSLEAVEAVAEEGIDVLGLLGALVDASLVRQQERHGRTYLTMLATVREYALEQLDTAGLVAPLRRRHAEYYADWGSRLGTDFDGPRQREVLVALADERDDLRSSQQELLGSGDWEYLARSCYALYPYWWVSGLLGEVRGRMDELLRSAGSVSDRARAIALWFSSMTRFFERQDTTVIGSLTESARLFARAGDDVGEAWVRVGLGLALTTSTPPAVAEATTTLTRAVALFHRAGVGWGESMAILPLGRLAYVQGDVPGAIEQFTHALELSEAGHNDFATSVVLSSLGWMKLLSGSVAEAVPLQERSLDLCIALHFPHGVAYQLESFLGIAGALGDVERAGLLGGAARSLRERLGLFNPSDAVLHLGIVEMIRSGPGAAQYDEAFEAGRRLSSQEAADVAREVAAAGTDPASAGPRAA